ncbi:hypothetical protein Tco_0916938 [Tanacetum coccineum]
MRTRNSNFPNNSNETIPRRRNKGRAPNIVEPELRTIVAPMAERTMEELLRAPTKGYGEAIVLPEINADHFEIKTNLLQLVQANPFHGLENENPHAHINSFKRITSTLRFRNVPNDVIKLMMFPYSLEGAVKTCEAWERFKEMLRACPHHGFTKLTQVDTFYNGLNDNDQDSLNVVAGGNLLSKTTREALNIIENKSKVRYSQNKPNASRINTTFRENDSKTDKRIDKLADQLSTLVQIVSKKVVTPAPVKAVEETCVTCGSAHSWYNCPTTDNNQASVCATTGFQAQNKHAPNNHVQQEISNDFSSYKRNNDQMLRNMQNQINSLKGDLKNEIQNTIKSQQAIMTNQQTTLQNNLQNMIGGLFQNHASTSGTLLSNTIPNPKGEMKAITTRSGVAYEGPSIPTNPSPKKVVERETEETTDKEQSNFQGSTAQIPPPVTPISILEPDVPRNLPKTTPIPEPGVPKSLPKPHIPYPSRLNQEKSRDKASNQGFQAQNNHAPNFQNQGFQNQPFQVPNNQVQQEFSNDFLSYKRNNDQMMRNMQNQINSLKGDLKNEIQNTIKSQQAVRMNQQNTFQNNLQNMICGLFQNNASTSGTLPSNTIPNPKGEIKAITTRSGVAYEVPSIPTNPSPKKVVERETEETMDKDQSNFQGTDPRVPLILGRSFLRTGRALIDVYEGELILRDGNEQIIFHVNGTTKHPQKHVNESIKMVNDTCKDSFKKFTDEPALVCLPPSEDDNDEKEKQEVKNLAESTAKRQTRITPCLKNFKVICKESIFHSNKTPQVSSVFAITSTLPSIEPKDSLIMGDEHLSTFSAEEIVPILRESEDTSRSDSKNVLPSCDDFSSINVPRDDSVTFSNPLFEFDVNFNSSDINPLFDEVLEDIECKDSYDSNLDESTFLVTPLSNSNKDECLAPGDDIEILLHHDPSTILMKKRCIHLEIIDDPPFEENDDLFDLECKTNDWKRILYDAPIDKASVIRPRMRHDEYRCFTSYKKFLLY